MTTKITVSRGIAACLTALLALSVPAAAQEIEAEALEVMGLGSDTDKARLRRRYSELVRRYHPDRNGGDRSYEARLNKVVDAYQLLRKASAIT